MICKKKLIYLKKHKAKQTFAYPPEFRWYTKGCFVNNLVTSNFTKTTKINQ